MKLRRLIDEQVTFDHLKGRIDAYSFLEELGVRTAYPLGKEIMCHCPDLHGSHNNGDATPGFGFNTEKLVYNCFVCGGGTILTLVQDILGVDERTALRYCEERSDLEPADVSSFQDEVERLLNPVEESQVLPSYSPDALFQHRYIHPYLLNRGISREILIEMQVGFDARHYGIVIPHFYASRLVGIQTRHLVQTPDGDFMCPRCYDPRKPVPKYKNTAEFPKRTTLYGYDRALAHKAQHVIVVESPMSALYLMTHGYDPVGAFGGFSDAQMMLLTRFARVSFWTDNDAAGQKNVLGEKKGKYGEREPGALAALSPFTNVDVIPLVEGNKSDPGDVPPEQIQRYIDEAIPAALLPIFGAIPTLEEVLATKK